MSPLKLLSTMIRGTHLFGLSCLLALSPLLHEGSAALAASAQDEARIVQALKQGGVTVLIRHSATDPGTGDPPGFKLSDCATQRNLSDGGREQARRLGQWFKANAIQVTAVRTSPWCRTRETATLAFGRSDDWSALSNLLSDRSRQGDQTKQVREAIAAQTDGAVSVFVSHGVSISAFVDVYLQQGEMVVVRHAGAAGNGGMEVVGRLLIP
ncbi:MAG TPA: histidine phosphatase family protein [Lautropia sp.]|nr:histidine phosphatase family protein [Lautropia sp.]